MSSMLLRSPDEEVRRAGVAALRAGEEELALLIEALGDDSWRVRKEAVERAASWADRDRASTALVEALAEPDNVGRRNAAVEALARIGGPAVAPLVAALGRGLEHRKLFVDTLGLIGDRRAAEAMVPFLDDTDPNVRAATAEALGLVGGPAAEQALLGALGRGELLLSLACLAALNVLGTRLTRERIEPLLSVAVIRPAALTALGATRDPLSAPILVRHLGEQSRVVREAATLALDALRASLDEDGRAAARRLLPELSEQGRRLLVQALLEGAPSTRRAAASVLGFTGGAQVVRPLVLALADAEVEEAAARALASLPSETVGALAAMAREVDPSLRVAIFRLVPSLPGASDPRLQEALVEAVAQEDSEAAAEAVHALGAVGGPEAIAPVLRALEREDLGGSAEEALEALSSRCAGEVRQAVLARGFSGPEAPHLCRALGACGAAADSAVLEGLLGGQPPALRAAAVEALAQLAGEGAFERIVGALDDASPEVRASATRALAPWPRSRPAIAARQQSEDDPLVRAVLAAALARPSDDEQR